MYKSEEKCQMERGKRESDEEGRRFEHMSRKEAKRND